jgi:hypothetical protein
MVEELSSGEGLDNESVASTKGELFDGCYFSPKKFEWTAPLKDACPFVLAKAGEGVDSKIKDDIKVLQAAVEDLGTLYCLLAKASREDSLEVLEYVWILVAEVIKAIDRLNIRVRVWKEVLGDFAYLREERGASDICSKLLGALGQLDSIELELGGRLDNMLARLDVWEGDDISNLTHLKQKVTGLMQIQFTHPPPVVTQVGFLLCLTTSITDANGRQIGVFGDDMIKLETLKTNNVKLNECLESFKVDVTAQGGVVFGQHTFTSEVQVLQVAMLDCSQGDVFGVFVNPILIFCHDTMYFPCGNWQKDTKAMEESGFMLTTNQKVLASYNLNNSFWFSEGKPIVAGKVISAFATAEK